MIIIQIITFRLSSIFPEISGKFPEILNFRKLYNPTYRHTSCSYDLDLDTRANMT